MLTSTFLIFYFFPKDEKNSQKLPLEATVNLIVFLVSLKKVEYSNVPKEISGPKKVLAASRARHNGHSQPNDQTSIPYKNMLQIMNKYSNLMKQSSNKQCNPA